jgi:uncharacterized membrane protein YbhN (UPF0104 family)
MLLEPQGYSIASSNAFWAISFGYLINLTIPRSGEIARATALYGVEKVPVEKAFGTIILERLVDVFFMLLFLLLTAFFKYAALISFYDYVLHQKNHTHNDQSFPWLFCLFLFGIIGMGGLLLFQKKNKNSGLYTKIIKFWCGLLEGFKSIINIKNKLKFCLYSVAIWLCYYLATYLVCFALPETSSFGMVDGLFLITIGTLGMLVPASGGIGAYHLALKLGIMGLFLAGGKNPELGAQVGLSYAFLSHTLQLFIMLCMGLMSIPILADRRNNIKK